MDHQETRLPAWQRATLFHKKPNFAPYGYRVFNGNLVGANSLKELKESFALENERVYTVWTPDSERFLPVSEVPQLLDQ